MADLLEADVVDELFWDPRLRSEEIAVTAQDGLVTLRGAVGSFREKREARRAAERVRGVTRVESELEVRLPASDRRGDGELREAVVQALALDSAVPASAGAIVRDGVVTLVGRVEWQFQRDEADLVAARVRGVVGIENQLYLTLPTPSPGDVKDSIERALTRAAKLDADRLSVSSSGGTVTLTGIVSSWSEHDQAVAAAWAAPGVRTVEDRILVEY